MWFVSELGISSLIVTRLAKWTVIISYSILTWCMGEAVADFPDVPVDTVGVEPRRGSIECSIDDLLDLGR